MILYNKAKNDRWEKADVCMAIISRFGTGGGNVPIILTTDEPDDFDEVEKNSSENKSRDK